MSLILSIFLGLKGLAIIIGTVVSTGGGGSVSLNITSVEVKSDTAWIEVDVRGIYSKELSDFFESGSVIPLELEALLTSNQGTVSRRAYTNFLQYDLAAKLYRIVKSGDTVTVGQKERAKDLFPGFRAPLFTAGDLDEENFYQIKISCRLGKVKLDILDMQEFDLMSLWNFKTPSLETKKFRRRDLEVEGK